MNDIRILFAISVLVQVVRRLRDRNEPIRLFGESDYESFQRLRKLEIMAPDINKGLRNDFKVKP